MVQSIERKERERECDVVIPPNLIALYRIRLKCIDGRYSFDLKKNPNTALFVSRIDNFFQVTDLLTS
jgi:hypothetical protein